MDFDKFYENYDNSIKKEDKIKENCCDNINNYNYIDGIVLCNQCKPMPFQLPVLQHSVLQF